MPRAPRLLARCLGLLACAVLAACDDAPGPPALLPEPPQILDLEVSPLNFNYTGTDPTVTIPLTLSAAVDEGDGGVTVRFVVRRQFEGGALAEGTLAPSGDRYTATASFEVERGDVGLYVVTAVAVGEGGVGNEATALVRYTAADLGRPVVAGASATPNPVPRGESFTITAEVTDPDGLANIARVVLENGGAEFQLCDDGNSGVCGFGGTDFPSPSGDAKPGDGRFSRRFSTSEDQEPGPFEFTVRAYDLAGQVSDPFPLTVIVQ
jgi:hypothetical protein